MEYSKNINDNTPILGKYKTVGEVKNAKIKSAIQVITRMKVSKEKTYLCKWLFDTHYLKKKFKGNLTERIKNIENKNCYNHIINHCFDGIDPLEVYKTFPILNDNCIKIIQSLHTVDSSGTGIFMDYLIRRIINEVRQTKFEDRRVDSHTSLDKIIIKNDKHLWQFNGDDEIGGWKVCKEPEIKSTEIISIQDKDRFIELERKDEWLKIKYKKNIGWVRYLVPDVSFTKGVSGNIKDYVPNKWFKKIEKEDCHYCESGCKMKMEQLCLYKETEPNECVFPYCQNMCYMKVQNTTKYKTTEVLKELYIVSCCHSESFGACPSQYKFDEIINILDKVNTSDFISPLIKICESLLFNCNKVLLNPALGCEDTPIPADCDIVIDDILIDIKCTKEDKDISEILQLLGYTSLLKYNKYNMCMNNVCIINLLQGKCKIYNIENISDDNLLEFLNLLTNKYNDNKKINIKTNDIKNIEYPLFVEQLKINYNNAKIIEQFDIEATIYENKMEEYYPGYKRMSHGQRKQCCPIYDEEEDPFDLTK